ncbi:MAG: hypothetical protein HN392_12375 [Anaerolineae bacterium]|jgi:predicted flap endonuclease-1-like 5' DNA nuclease|nr:hypothetical protein [Anaerolineae bacterium]MBT7073344.1 hypothetical protein [Anaerolineae bacterium]MBT7783382.1 hypothetical protein [Anaerolineae bacterium]
MRFFVFLLGIVTGWFLKDSNWKKWLETLKAYLEPQPIAEPTIPLLTEEKAEEISPDPLEKIKGIGPAIKSKLNDQGIFTFAQLGALSSTELEEIVGASIKRFADEAEIIRLAQKLAK